jgi:hypothetical protein
MQHSRNSRAANQGLKLFYTKGVLKAKHWMRRTRSPFVA